MTREKKTIAYESDEAASIQTVTGWVSSNGQFWGNDERTARFAGSTHRTCEKNPAHGVHETRAWCDRCREERVQAQYHAMPRETYDGRPVVVHDDDQYFFDCDSLRDWLIDNRIEPKDAQLVFCVPNNAAEIDPSEHFADDMPEDGDEGVFSTRLLDAFSALNAAIRDEPPLSWRPGKIAVSLPDDFLD